MSGFGDWLIFIIVGATAIVIGIMVYHEGGTWIGKQLGIKNEGSARRVGIIIIAVIIFGIIALIENT